MVGVGVLVGLSVMFFIIVWVGLLFVGCCDFDGFNGMVIDFIFICLFDLFGIGVIIDE